MEKEIKKIIEEYFKTINYQICYRLMGGMSNYTYLIKINKDESFYTVRFPGEYSEYFVNRDNEEKDIKLFEKIGVTNKTVYFNKETGVKISCYVEGKSLNELKEDYPYLMVSNLLKKIHQTDLKCPNDYNPFKRLELDEKYLTDLNYELPTKYIKLKEYFYLYKEYLESQQKVVCHNDSQPSNFILGNDLKIVDFEFVGNNDCLYDIACFGNMKMKDAIELLNVYFNEVNDDILLRFYLWRAFQCFQWFNVAMFKDLVGMSQTLKLDFKAIAFNYLKEIEDNLNIVKTNKLAK